MQRSFRISRQAIPIFSDFQFDRGQNFLSFSTGIAQLNKFCFELVAEITLDDYFTVLGRSAAAAECLQGTGQRVHIGLWADESADDCNGFAAATVFFYTLAQFLLLWRQ